MSLLQPGQNDAEGGPAANRVLEARIEAKAVRRARKRGWRAFKMGGPGNFNGLPDRLFLKNRLYVWIEFKRPKKKPTPNQLRVHAELRAEGAIVHVCDDADDAIMLLDGAERPGANWNLDAADL